MLSVLRVLIYFVCCVYFFPFSEGDEAAQEVVTGTVRLICLQIQSNLCLLYTSDAADEEDSVDLGGRRIIKKKI